MRGHKGDHVSGDEVNIDRRAMLGGAVASLGVLSSGAAKAKTKPRKLREAKAGPAPGTFTVVGAGEFMITRNLMKQTEAPFRSVVERLRNADLCYAHLEMVLGKPSNLKWTPRGAGGASYMNADPSVAQDLADMGIDVMSLAMNHSFDWGPEGIQSTIDAMDAVGIAHAGTGSNLMAARAPSFFDVDAARCALVSIASGNNEYEWAGLPIGTIQGRPGVNPMRVETRYTIDEASAAQLKAIGQKLGVMTPAQAAKPQFNITPGTGLAGTGSSTFTWVAGDHFEIGSVGYAPDIAANLRSIHWGREMADFVMVAHHNSTAEGTRSENPSGFVVDFARKAIDAGADVYFGHGWHTFLGIEIYKGKPIIYGMGNFVYESEHLTRVPVDSFESYRKDIDNLTALYPTADMHPSGGEDWFWTALYEMDWVGGELKEVRLYPVEMGMDFSSGKGVQTRTTGLDKIVEGTPYLASGANAQAILKRIQHRCELRGTKMQIRGEIGVITVEDH